MSVGHPQIIVSKFDCEMCYCLAVASNIYVKFYKLNQERIKWKNIEYTNNENNLTNKSTNTHTNTKMYIYI